MADKKICKYLGFQIYFNEFKGEFFCDVGEFTHCSYKLSELKDSIKKEVDTRLSLDVIYCGSGEMEKVKVVKVIDAYRGINLILDSNRLGVGVPNNTEPKNLYPLTEKNVKLFEEHVKLRDEGWDLIRKADSMYKTFDSFEKDFFYKKLKASFSKGVVSK